MKAARITKTGSIDHISVEEIPQPQPGPGEALVKMAYGALNHLDLFVTRGAIPHMSVPQTLGSDGAGVVESVGEGVRVLKPGDRVAIHPSQRCGVCEFCTVLGDESLCPRTKMIGENCDGTYAEYLTIKEANAHKIPDGFSMKEAAATGVTYVTAWRMLKTKIDLQPGEIVLILGIGGGVSLAALDLCLDAGAEVWVTSGSDEKLQKALALGAHKGFNYAADPDWDRAVRAATGKRGVDVVVESVGKASWKRSLNVLRYGGRLVTCGATTGHDPQTDIMRIFWKQLSVLGSTMGTNAEFMRMLQWAGRKSIRPKIDSVFPLEKIQEAERRLSEAKQFGKILVEIDPTLT